MDIKIDTTNMQVSVLSGTTVMKTEDITVDELRGYMAELCKDELMLNALRLTARKMKVTSYIFKEIE